MMVEIWLIQVEPINRFYISFTLTVVAPYMDLTSPVYA